MASKEDAREGEIADLSNVAADVGCIGLNVGVTRLFEGGGCLGLNREADLFTTKPWQIPD
jgi:hypothetical protein